MGGATTMRLRGVVAAALTLSLCVVGAYADAAAALQPTRAFPGAAAGRNVARGVPAIATSAAANIALANADLQGPISFGFGGNSDVVASHSSEFLLWAKRFNKLGEYCEAGASTRPRFSLT